MINKQMKIIEDKFKNIKDAHNGFFSEYYHYALEVLRISLGNKIEYFKTASEEMDRLNCTWEESSLKFKSKDLVNEYLELHVKYPMIIRDHDADIELAKAAMNYVG